MTEFVQEFIEANIDAIDESLLTNDEIQWINNYHENVYNLIAPYLNEEEIHWLKQNTRPIK